jgi:CheY-like chemotaxis protein/PAS domain-containing protein
MSRFSLLFVDDEPDVLDILEATFVGSGEDYEILRAPGGEEALEIITRRRIDLLISDQRMKPMTGIELVRRAREHSPDLTSILLTAYTDPADLQDAINKAGVYRYLTKPWDREDLLQTVKHALEQVVLRREKEWLLGQLRRRLEAIEAASDIARDAAEAPNHAALVEALLQRIPRVVPCDVAAALVAPVGVPAVLVIHRRVAGGEESLLALKEQMLADWAEQGGRTLPSPQVRLCGEPSSRPAGEARSRLTVPLEIDGTPTGLIALLSAEENAYGEDDARVLDLLANQLAQSVRSVLKKLGEQRRRIERVVECMADGVVVADAKTEEIIVNPAARRLLNVPEGQALTTRWLQEKLGFYPFELVRGWEYAGAQVMQEEVRIDERTLHSVITPVTDSEGRLGGVAVVLRDVSEQKALDERKDEFVQVVSHELRTPLTAITGALDLVLNGLAGEVAEKQTRYLKMARDSTEKLNLIVDDLLDLAKLAKGKMKMELEVLHLDELARSAIEKYAPAAVDKGVEIVAETPVEPLRLMADSGRIGQVLSNLLTNAVKFTPANGRIVVSVFRPVVEGWLGFSVWNSGAAIPTEDLERIFERFEQSRAPVGAGGKAQRVRGTGLGLAICRSIVEAHGGRIWAEGTAGAGARFVAVLPAQPPAERAPSKEAAPHVAPGREPPLVLVVDDEQDVTFVLKGLLLARGYRCAVAHDGEEALALARKLKPAVACVDVRMPEIDGLRLCEILRHDPETRSMPVVVASAPEEREKAFRAGASTFLAKPFGSERFIGSVEALLRVKRAGGRKILVVDDDPAVRTICTAVLADLGYGVLQAETCAEARRLVREARPDLVLLDVSLPDGDGFDLLEELKEERAAGQVSVVFVTARGQTGDKVRGFRLGADDYVVKPFDTIELGARVDTVLRRKESELAASPTTRLPGGRAIEREVERRLEARVPFALCYLDLDNLKAFNDHYGYAKADGVIQQTGDLLRDVVHQQGGETSFVGHIAGDDFVFIVPFDKADQAAGKVIEAFDKLIPLYYEREDRERGFIEADDRYGVRRRFPVMSVSIVGVMAPAGRWPSHAEMAKVAADLKRRAKAVSGSVFLRDDRTEDAQRTA